MSNEEQQNENGQDLSLEVTQNEQQGIAEFFATDFVKDLEEAKPVLALAKVHLDFKKKGDSHRLIFLGFSTYPEVDKDTGETEDVVIANFANAERKLFYTRAYRILQDLRGCKLYSKVEITYEGEERLKGGNTLKHYNCMLLN